MTISTRFLVPITKTSQKFCCMVKVKANSNVKLVGTNTLGILSGMLGKSIGPFYCTLSNQRLMLPKGKYYEVSGVEPDIKMTVFPKENIFGGHSEAVKKIVQIIDNKL